MGWLSIVAATPHLPLVILASEKGFAKEAARIEPIIAKALAGRIHLRRVELAPMEEPEAAARSVDEAIAAKPAILIVGNSRRIPSVAARNFDGTVVLMTHDRWNGDDRSALPPEWRFPKLVVLSSDTKADEACILWLRRLKTDATTIGVITNRLWDPSHLARLRKEAEQDRLGIRIFDVSTTPQAVELMARSGELGIGGWYFPSTEIVFSEPEQITHSAIAHGVPTAFEVSHYYTRVGGLISCAYDIPIAHGLIDGIRLLVDGADATSLPVIAFQQFSLSINLDTAEKLKIAVPPDVLRQFHRFVP